MRSLLIVVHIVAAIALLAILMRQLALRSHDVNEVRAQWTVDHAETMRMRHEMELQRTLLGGLRGKDPYVVELMARERHDYSRPGEFALPEAPVVDKTQARR
jgi:hypothetical protein